MLNADRLKLRDSAIHSDARVDFADASDEMDNASYALANSSDARKNASNLTDEAHSFVHHEEFREPAPTIDEQGTPSTPETD